MAGSCELHGGRSVSWLVERILASQINLLRIVILGFLTHVIFSTRGTYINNSGFPKT
jgi:hypothetical protein